MNKIILDMTEDERKNRITELVDEIKNIRPEHSYLGIRIRTKTWKEGEDQAETEKKWNNLDDRLFNLEKEHIELQIEYWVEYLDTFGILGNVIVRLNRNVSINTKTNGWKPYMYKTKVNELIYDISELLNKVQILHINKL